MSLDDKQYLLFEENLRKARPRFQDGDFARVRRDVWTRMLQRLLPVKLEEELEKWADGIDIETPDIEHFANEPAENARVSYRQSTNKVAP